MAIDGSRFKARLSERGHPQEVQFVNDAMRPIMNYPWPGNARELANMVEHSLICSVDGVVRPESLQQYCDARRQRSAKPTANTDDRENIQNALHRADGNRTLAAQILNIDCNSLWRKMQRMGIE